MYNSHYMLKCATSDMRDIHWTERGQDVQSGYTQMLYTEKILLWC